MIINLVEHLTTLTIVVSILSLTRKKTMPLTFRILAGYTMTLQMTCALRRMAQCWIFSRVTFFLSLYQKIWKKTPKSQQLLTSMCKDRFVIKRLVSCTGLSFMVVWVQHGWSSPVLWVGMLGQCWRHSISGMMISYTLEAIMILMFKTLSLEKCQSGSARTKKVEKVEQSVEYLLFSAAR